MSDPPALPAPEEPPAEALPPPERPAQRPLLPWFTAAGFVILALAIAWVWRHPVVQPAATEPVDSLRRQVSTLEARVTQLEQRPVPQAPDLAPLTARVTALEQRPTPQPPPAAPAPDLRPLEARLTKLEQREPADLQPLEKRIAALEANQQTDSNLPNRIASLENAVHSMESDLSHRADAAAAAARRTALVQSAALALAAGQKLGDLPGAPPALVRFADADPPTLARLRQAFPAAAREALRAARPSTEGKPLAARLWAQAQDLVTVQQGDRVLVGDPAAGVLERARDALNAGDLSAATTEVATLQGAAGQAMANWLAQARALLAARAALAAWAAPS
jgi:hypothetical protein